MERDEITQEQAEKFQEEAKGLIKAFNRFVNGTPKAALNNLKSLLAKVDKMEKFVDEEDDDGEA